MQVGEQEFDDELTLDVVFVELFLEVVLTLLLLLLEVIPVELLLVVELLKLLL